MGIWLAIQIKKNIYLAYNYNSLNILLMTTLHKVCTFTLDTSRINDHYITQISAYSR